MSEAEVMGPRFQKKVEEFRQRFDTATRLSLWRIVKALFPAWRRQGAQPASSVPSLLLAPIILVLFAPFCTQPTTG